MQQAVAVEAAVVEGLKLRSLPGLVQQAGRKAAAVEAVVVVVQQHWSWPVDLDWLQMLSFLHSRWRPAKEASVRP